MGFDAVLPLRFVFRRNRIADVVVRRANSGKHFGIIVVPEGLIMHITELVALIDDMNKLLASGVATEV